MNKILTQKNLFFLLAFICLCYGVFFKPIMMQDGSGYMEIAKIFAGIKNPSIDTSDRQPFYSIILSIFYRIFNGPFLLKAIIIFQYMLIFLNSILLFKIFQPLIKNTKILFLVPIFYLINLTTVFYGYMVLTETLASFLFILLVYLLVQLPNKLNSYWYYLFIGVVNALLFLTRFSTFFLLIMTPAIIIFYYIFLQKKVRPILFLSKVSIFLIPVAISLCSLSYYNLKRNNFFFLFPTTGTISHYYSILSTLDKRNVVSNEYRYVDSLLLQKKDSIENIKIKLKKGSLLNYIGKEKFQGFTLGWGIYANAEQELFNYYKLHGNNRNRAILAKHLSGFYKQIEKQNRKKLFSFRFNSFLLCLRANNITLTDEFAKTNLNKLPVIIIKGYKIFIILFIGCFYLFSLFFIIKFIRFKNINYHFRFICLMMFVLYFPLTGMLTADVYNITRYKFLSELLIIGLMFYYFGTIQEYLVSKKREKLSTKN